eukprot:8503943-Pyramimonas_sp.AAC.1
MRLDYFGPLTKEERRRRTRRVKDEVQAQIRAEKALYAKSRVRRRRRCLFFVKTAIVHRLCFIWGVESILAVIGTGGPVKGKHSTSLHIDNRFRRRQRTERSAVAEEKQKRDDRSRMAEYGVKQ